MKMITLAAAAILMAGSSAYAGSGISFEINGQKIHVEAPRNCDALSCIKITAPGLNLNSLNLKSFNLGGDGNDDDATVASTAPAAATPPTPSAQAAASPTPSRIANSTPTAVVTPSAPAAVASTTAATIAPANPAPVAATAAAPAEPAANAAAPAQETAAAPAPNSPLGVWATEENKGNVRIEPCGANLCGYADKTNEKILINMKPSDNKWVGRIHDPDHGGNYDSTIALKGPNVLKVQGCAFGGMFCGGQTWKRVS